MDKRTFLQAASVMTMLLATQAVAQSNVSKVTRIVVPFATGGTTDVIARILQPELARSFGNTVIVENKAGAGGRLGANEVARAPADGHTIALVADGFAIDTLIYKDMAYDPFKDFVPVSQLARVPLVLVARSSLPAEDVTSLVTLAMREPGRISFGSVGVGSAQHLAGEFFAQKAGLKLLHVPYKGGSGAQTDMMAGTLDIFWGSAAFAKPAIASGKIKALGVASERRSLALPGLQTLAEQGFNGYELYGWTGFVLPAGTPVQVVNHWYETISRVMKLPEIEKRLSELGWESITSSPEVFGQFIRAENTKWAQILKQANFSMQ
jgi:tripartite-type tricarboxylate transporter receptor subunit TctC